MAALLSFEAQVARFLGRRDGGDRIKMDGFSLTNTGDERSTSGAQVEVVMTYLSSTTEEETSTSVLVDVPRLDAGASFGPLARAFDLPEDAAAGDLVVSYRLRADADGAPALLEGATEISGDRVQITPFTRGADTVLLAQASGFAWVARGGDDEIYGSAGDDEIRGGGGADEIYGGVGNDTLFGQNKNDELYGNDGDDVLAGGGGGDTLAGGEGDDQLDGGGARDSLYGDAGVDTLNGGAGGDLLFGGDGDDALNGDAGNDRLSGEGGADNLLGGEGNDRLAGGAGDDSLNGEAGNDKLFGDDGADTLLGEDGNDLLTGAAGNDTLDGGAGNDRLNGDGGDDSLTGGAGDDKLYGGAGDDTISGGDGDDYINAGEGSDIMTGGAGNDVFRFGKQDFDADVITDFAEGDVIDLRMRLVGLEAVEIAEVGDDVVVTVKALLTLFGDLEERVTITLQDAKMADLGDEWLVATNDTFDLNDFWIY